MLYDTNIMHIDAQAITLRHHTLGGGAEAEAFIAARPSPFVSVFSYMESKHVWLFKENLHHTGSVI